MKKFYALCPWCGERTDNVSFIQDRTMGKTICVVECSSCGTARFLYKPDRILTFNLYSPYTESEYFDLLVPPGMDMNDAWERVMKRHQARRKGERCV